MSEITLLYNTAPGQDMRFSGTLTYGAEEAPAVASEGTRVTAGTRVTRGTRVTFDETPPEITAMVPGAPLAEADNEWTTPSYGNLSPIQGRNWQAIGSQALAHAA